MKTTILLLVLAVLCSCASANNHYETIDLKVTKFEYSNHQRVAVLLETITGEKLYRGFRYWEHLPHQNTRTNQEWMSTLEVNDTLHLKNMCKKYFAKLSPKIIPNVIPIEQKNNDVVNVFK
jgi:chemotaxis methyl-accepting protein methylase